MALLWNQNDLAMQMRCTAAQAEAKKLGIVTQLLGVRAPNDFADAFGEMDRHPPDAILLVADSLTVTNHRSSRSLFPLSSMAPAMRGSATAINAPI